MLQLPWALCSAALLRSIDPFDVWCWIGAVRTAFEMRASSGRAAVGWSRIFCQSAFKAEPSRLLAYKANTMKASLRKRFPRISFCNKRVRLSVSRCVKRTVNPCLFSTLFAAKGDPKPDPHLRSRSFPRLQCQHFHFQITHTEKYSVVRTPKEYRCYFLPLSEMY